MDTDTARTCGKCGTEPVGPGGVLCPACRELLAGQLDDYWEPAPAPNPE